ncbi:glycosyltransferase family 4 protein [Lysobacter sp. A286]
MRYAIVTETYPPEVNGVALTVRDLEHGLRELGHEVGLVRPRQTADCQSADHELLIRGVPLPRYSGLQIGLPATRALIRHWRAMPPDAIYIATEGPLGWSALRAARQLGIPAATGLHTRFDHYMRDYGFAWLGNAASRWMRHFHNRADATLVPTHELAGLLRSQGFRQVRRLPRAVDCNRFTPDSRDPTLRAQWGVGPDDPVAINVGRIAPEKNLDLAIRAYRRLQEAHPRARFVWVGDGPERARLEREHPDFIFCGVQRGNELARHFASGDLFLFPSHSETFGNVTLEAMASGVPPVAFNYGAAREHLRDGVHGAAIDDGDDTGFIAAAVNIGGDAQQRADMARRGREAVMSLQPQQVARDFDALLRDLVARRKDESIALASTSGRR